MNINLPAGPTGAPSCEGLPLPNKQEVHLELYVINGAPNSDRALANLEQICKHENYNDVIVKIDIIDVAANPLRLMQSGIIVTPTLLRISPLPEVRVLGNLSDRDKVERALGLNAGFDVA